MFGHSILWSYSPPLHHILLLCSPLLISSITPLLTVCMCTHVYHRVSDHGCCVFMITTPILNSGDSICCISPLPWLYSLPTFLFPCSLGTQRCDSDVPLGTEHSTVSLIRIWLVMITGFYIFLPSLDDSVKYKCWLIYLSIHFLFSIRLRQMHIFQGNKNVDIWLWNSGLLGDFLKVTCYLRTFCSNGSSILLPTDSAEPPFSHVKNSAIVLALKPW